MGFNTAYHFTILRYELPISQVYIQVVKRFLFDSNDFLMRWGALMLKKNEIMGVDSWTLNEKIIEKITRFTELDQALIMNVSIHGLLWFVTHISRACISYAKSCATLFTGLDLSLKYVTQFMGLHFLCIIMFDSVHGPSCNCDSFHRPAFLQVLNQVWLSSRAYM